ncbi:MAG: sodium:alanine symporter family protein [Clostridia bacterium]|nr:sodium:alanine symporter family protein [Clostridia bacterium]
MLDGILEGLCGGLWQGALLPCVFLFGLYATLRTRFFQVTRFPRMLRETFGGLFGKSSESEGSVTPFQALCTALAGTVGTGSVVGTCQAVAVGGPGALFWMWIAAFFGMIIKFFEVTLATLYRQINKDGEWVGGPMYYILRGMGPRFKPLGAAFALFALFSSLGMGCLAQASGVVDGVRSTVAVLLPEAVSDGLLPLGVGITMGIVLAFALSRGAVRVGRVAEILVPVACSFFLILTIGVIWHHRARLGETLGMILRCAFSGKALFGAGAGIGVKKALEWGLRRSAFSNEAGLGSAAIAHASAKTPHPVHQGFFGMFEVFADTLVVCSLTGLSVLITLPPEEILSRPTPDATLIVSAVSTLIGPAAARVSIGLSLALFAFSTLLGWSLYGARCARFLFGKTGERLYRPVFVLCAVLGSVFAATSIWALSDLFNALMAIPNFIALIVLFPRVTEQMADYFAEERKRRRNAFSLKKDLTQPPECGKLSPAKDRTAPRSGRLPRSIQN